MVDMDMERVVGIVHQEAAENAEDYYIESPITVRHYSGSLEICQRKARIIVHANHVDELIRLLREAKKKCLE